MRPVISVVTAAVAATLCVAPAAVAGWPSAASGAGAAKAALMPSGSQPSASVTGRSTTVSWSQNSFPGGVAVAGYVVKRYASGGAVQTVGAGCAGTVDGLTCTEDSVPSGTWRYTVTPKHGNWLGTESAQSASVSVASPALAFSSSTTVTALPTTLAGSISGFLAGQTVTYRLDDASTGTVLAGSISPSPVPSSGGATVSVALPAGTSNGSHTVYAVGSSGDVASAAITVSVATSATVTTSAWNVRDASAGSAEVDATTQPALADGRTFATGLWSTTFGTKYIEFDHNDPLPSGGSVSGAAFNFRFAAAAAGEEACVHLELRRISTGAVISTHGSSSSPLHCVTGTTLQTFTTSLPQLNTTALANDARVRIFARESASKAITIDLATITGSTASTAFTLYTTAFVDGTSTPATSRWGPATSGDGSAYTSLANWAASFSASRYLRMTFPAYVPSGASVTSATLRNHYRPTSAGRSVCWYFELYAGATLIGTHGSTAAPISCNSATTYTTDSVALPAVNTAARANSLSVKLFYNISGSGTRTTQQDLVQLSVTYSQ